MTRWPISRAAAIGVVWMCLTPLGSPVEPEVYIQNATSSDSVGATNRSGAPRARRSVKSYTSRPRNCRLVVGVGADQDDGAQVRQAVEHGHERLGQRRRSNDRRGAAVAEDVGVLLGVEQRVERQHDDAGAHAAPERHRKIDGVVEQEAEPLFRPQPERLQRAGKPAAARLQFAVAERTIGIGESDFFAKPARDLAVDEVGDGVVRPAL